MYIKKDNNLLQPARLMIFLYATTVAVSLLKYRIANNSIANKIDSSFETSAQN